MIGVILMRQRTLKSFFDKFFWFIVSAMPLIYYAFSFLSRAYTPVPLDQFFSVLGVKVESTLVYGTLLDLFGTGGICPLFDSPEIFSIMAWFVNVQLIHLAVDFLLFIPRLAHSFMDRWCTRD